jgi:hypothetical protein
MSEENGSEPKPAFDFSQVGYGWEFALAENNARMLEVKVLNDTPARDGLSAFDAARIELAKLEALTRSPQLVRERDALIAQVIAEVPREWLLPSAPATLDWSDPKSLWQLRSGRIDDVMMALQEALTESKKKS